MGSHDTPASGSSNIKNGFTHPNLLVHSQSDEVRWQTVARVFRGSGSRESRTPQTQDRHIKLGHLSDERCHQGRPPTEQNDVPICHHVFRGQYVSTRIDHRTAACTESSTVFVKSVNDRDRGLNLLQNRHRSRSTNVILAPQVSIKKRQSH